MEKCIKKLEEKMKSNSSYFAIIDEDDGEYTITQYSNKNKFEEI